MRYSCPACKAALRLRDDLPAGKRVRCPKCGEPFSITAKPVRRALESDDEYDDDEEPRPVSPRSGRKKRSSNTALYVGLGVLGTALLVGGAIAIVARSRKSDPAVASSNPVAPAPPAPAASPPAHAAVSGADPSGTLKPPHPDPGQPGRTPHPGGGSGSDADAFEKPLPAPGASAAQLPPELQKSEQRFREMYEWNRRTLGDMYEKVGKKDPRWDKWARSALEAAARRFSRQVHPQVGLADIYVRSRNAIDAGCDDPLILYMYAHSSGKPNHPGEVELARRYAAAATAMKQSAYPPCRRATALTYAGVSRTLLKQLSPQDRKEAAQWLDAALALLPTGLEEEEQNPFTSSLWYDLAREIIDTQRTLARDYQAAFDPVDAALARHPSLKHLRLKVRADFLVTSGWEARGKGLADTVTPQGWKTFEARLTEAHDLLEKAWEAEPGDAQVATRMLTVQKGIGGDRPTMEKWFERAVQADPNNLLAYTEKLDWLDPKWHGSMPDMLDFGRACRDTRNSRAGITLLYVDAHRRAANRLPDNPRREYYRSPQLWTDIREIYEEYLEYYPLDHAVRSRYALYCYNCGQQAESYRQFQIVGDNFIHPRPFNEKAVRQIREQVLKTYGSPQGTPRP